MGRNVDRTEASARFAALVARAEPEITLDEPALLIAAHHHALDVDAQLRALDGIAASAGSAGDDPVSLARLLFTEAGFTGNTVDYGDPRNSFLDEVIRRRLGLPITLSVLLIEVARRRGIELAGVGMPGHFLVATDRGYLDPFHGGTLLDAQGARRRFEELRPGAPFSDHYLDPVGPRAVLARMLANLVGTFLQRAPLHAVWALRLRLAITGLAPSERLRDAEQLRRLQARLN